MRDDGTGTTTGRRVVAVVSVAVALLAVGAVAALQGHPVFGEVPSLGGGAQPPLPTAQPQPTDSPPEIEPTEPNPLLGIIAIVIVSLVVLVILFFVIRALIQWLRTVWQERPLKRVDALTPEDGGAEPAAEPEVHAPVVRSALAVALEAVDTHAVPSDAIVAAWVGLEQSADQAGLHRGRSETPGEFTVRIVGSRPGAADDIRALLRLYERVRFGGYAAGEPDRAEARTLLRSIEEEWR